MKTVDKIAHGEILKELINSYGYSIGQVASRVRKPKKVIEKVIGGKYNIDDSLATRLSQVFGTSKDFWLK